MKTNNINILWAVSLIIIGAGAIVLAGANIAGLDLPDALIRVLGIAVLIALPVMVFTTIKKIRK